jgi:hypothetical protein
MASLGIYLFYRTASHFVAEASENLPGPGIRPLLLSLAIPSPGWNGPGRPAADGPLVKFAEILMRSGSNIVVLTALTLIASTVAPAARAQLWKQFVPVSHSEPVPKGDTTLTQDNGPWMIMAASFQGDGAEQQAQDLAQEFRNKQHLPAFVHDQTFDFSGENPGRGMDNYGAPVRRRYQHEKSHEFAVLVGNFPKIDDPEAQKTLERVKTMQSEVFKLDGDDAASGFDRARQVADSMLEKVVKQKEHGPMGKAFMTHNPLLPKEYFVPKGVDDFIAKMNKAVDHSLLDCPGKYTVQVATFRGKIVLQTSSKMPDSPAAFSWPWQKDKSDPLAEAAEDAHLLTEELRAHGFDAYEFHDRTQSIVTVGALNDVGQRAADGQLAATPQVQKIIETFGAAYDTPSDPLSKVGSDASTQRRVEEVKHRFSEALTSQSNGQVTPGMHPKHVKIVQSGHLDRIVPMDVYPHTIEVPRRSISSAYAGAN